jgi:NTE family protein
MKQYENLVLEGGGVKGIAYVGALMELENKGILKNIKKVAGTSAGAITALLIALRYSSDEIMDIMFELDFNKFVDKSRWKTKNFYDVITKFGIAKGDYFQNWIEDIIYRKIKLKNVTFSDFIRNNNFCDLMVVGVNLTKRNVEIFSYKTTPNILLSTAIRISMSIPLFFHAVKYNNDIYIDGGLFWNYPLRIYDNNKINPKTLGLRIDSTKTNLTNFIYDTTFNTNNLSNKPSKVTFFKYLKLLLNVILNQQDSKHIQQLDWDRTISIWDTGVGAIEFNINDREKYNLVKAGKDAVIKYFKRIEKEN